MSSDDPVGEQKENNFNENDTSNVMDAPIEGATHQPPSKQGEIEDGEGNDHAVEEEDFGGQQQRDSSPRSSSNNGGNDDGDDSTSVQVAVRIRPLLAMEADTDECIRVIDNNSALQFGSSGPRFTFDYVFPKQTTQRDFFDKRVTQLVDSCLEGYNATILAYGQTGRYVEEDKRRIEQISAMVSS